MGDVLCGSIYLQEVSRKNLGRSEFGFPSLVGGFLVRGEPKLDGIN